MGPSGAIGIVRDAPDIHHDGGRDLPCDRISGKEEDGVPLSTALGWLLTRLSVLMTKAVESGPVLVVNRLRLPAGIGLTYMEPKGGSRSDKTLVWLGVLWLHVIPYRFVYSASVEHGLCRDHGTVTIWWLEASRAGSYTLGPMMVFAQEGHLTSDWDGNGPSSLSHLARGDSTPMLDQLASRSVLVSSILLGAIVIVFVGAIGPLGSQLEEGEGCSSCHHVVLALQERWHGVARDLPRLALVEPRHVRLRPQLPPKWPAWGRCSSWRWPCSASCRSCTPMWWDRGVAIEAGFIWSWSSWICRQGMSCSHANSFITSMPPSPGQNRQRNR